MSALVAGARHAALMAYARECRREVGEVFTADVESGMGVDVGDTIIPLRREGQGQGRQGHAA